MERRIIILSDNRTDTPLLGTEHGLSAYMEYGEESIYSIPGLPTCSCLMLRNWV